MLTSPPLRRRPAPVAWPWRALGVAALAAAGLHLLAWACLRDTGLTGTLGATTASPLAQGIQGIQVRLTRPLASAASVSAPTAPAAPAEQPHLATPTRSTPTRASPYWPADALERSPQPELGWIVDEPALERVQHARVLLKLWVSDLGRIDRVELLRAEPPGDWPDQALRALADTRMLPGLRQGQPVHATVVVEIAAEVERFQ